MSSLPAFAIDSLQQMERTCRRRLEQEPADTSSRLSLAWCLALQALYEAGRESSASALLHACEALDDPVNDRMRSAVEDAALSHRDADCLLRNCLQQAVTVQHLSASPQERRDVEKLRALVHLSGFEQAVVEADANAERILNEISQAIAGGAEE